jgi:hypothetical protein
MDVLDVRAQMLMVM